MTVLKSTEEFNESYNLFFMCLVDKAKADRFVLLNRRVVLDTRRSFMMIHSLLEGWCVPHVQSLRIK